ncbi:hypothetical protein HB364_10440 [Pseudoflavitalea sp. X16]|uniref:hypothetical protein n=1 Tax=Paraflavitalea devenefica TaxID=2716334 RepID=UPI00142260C0|nr:hypothetical protein [Paraflavitalea devenefica]NII25502.1 hypothetical protein [Paraflavitalea devenefica]
MYSRSILFFLVCSVLSLLADAQDLNFEKSGRLSHGPDPKIKQGSTLTIKVSADTTAMHEQWAGLQQRFTYLQTVASQNGTTAEKLEALKQLLAHYQFFSGTMWKEKESVCKIWEKFLADNCLKQSTIDDFLKANNNLKPDKIPVINDCGNACVCDSARNRIEQLKYWKTKLFEIEQKETLIRILLCEFKSQLGAFQPDDTTLRFRDSLLKKNTYLTAFKGTGDSLLAPKTILLGANLTANKVNLPLTYHKGEITYEKELTVPENSSFNIQIKSQNLYQKGVIDWYNNTVSTLDADYLQMLTGIVKTTRKNITPLLTCVDCKGICDQAKIDSLKKIRDSLKVFDTVWCFSNPIGRWLTQWLWYSGGEFKLNYFSFTEPARFPGIDTLGKKQALIDSLKEIKEKIASLKKCTSCSIKSLDTLYMLQTAEKTVDSNLKVLTNLLDQPAQNEKKYKEGIATGKLLHDLTLPLYTSNRKRYVLYHDAANRFERDLDEQLAIPDDRIIYHGFYNAKEKDTTGVLTIAETFSPFNDTSTFTRTLLEATSGLGSAISGLSPLGSAVSFLKELTASRTKVPISSTQESVAGDCLELLKQVKVALWRFELLEKLLQNYTALPTPGVITVSDAPDANFYTYAVKARTGNIPYTNDYTYTYKTKQVNADRFSVGRTKLISIGAGVFFNDKRAPQVDLKTDSGQFKLTTTDTRAKFVVGVKVFPAKAFEADGKIVPDYPLKRFSIFAGFEATDPLANMYLGIGYDVVPGLHLSTGFHFYRNKYYNIQNNEVVSKSSDYKVSGLYYGITLDPVVLTGIIKSLFQ